MAVETETADSANLSLVKNIHLAELRLAETTAQVRAEVNTISKSHSDRTTGKQKADLYARYY